LLAELPHEGLHQALPSLHAAAGQQPVLLARLLLPAEQDPALPEQERGDAEARLHQRSEEPKPRTPRSDSGSSSTSTSSTSGSGTTTSCAMRMPGSTRKVSRGSVFSSATRSSPR